jgi:predicted hydrocarbon binding protein
VLGDKFSFQFETFRDMEEALELIFSPSAASLILFTAAVRCGTQCFKRTAKRVNKRQDAFLYLAELKREENWGDLSFREVNFERGTGTIRVANSFETVAMKREETSRTSQPCCHFLRGFLAGFLSEFFQRTLTVTEEKCCGKGDHCCEFTFMSGEAESVDLV